MTDVFAQPDDLGEIKSSDLQTSLGERLGAQFGEAFFGATRTLVRGREYAQAESGQESLGSQIQRLQNGEDLNDVVSKPQPPAEIAIDDAKARVKQEGLEGRFKLPDQPSIKAPVLDLMIDHAHERQQYDTAVNRGPQGFIPGALGLVTEIGAGVIDPVNIAAFSVPVMGEARMGMMIARAGESLAARAGVKAGIGAAQGAIGSTALVPGDWWLHTKDGVDYTMADALHSVVMGAGMGGAFHAAIGAYGDLRARGGGVPLPGTVLDLQTRALRGDAQAAELLDRMKVKRADDGSLMTPENGPADALGTPPVREAPAGEEVPGISPAAEAPAVAAPADIPTLPEDLPPGHPASVLADLPPQAREDVARASMADVINGNAVRAGELLEESAKGDPRIAESINLDRRGAEQVLAPAVVFNGKTYVGTSHLDAIEKAAAEHGTTVEDIHTKTDDAKPQQLDAWVTSSGRVIDSKEAARIVGSPHEKLDSADRELADHLRPDRRASEPAANGRAVLPGPRAPKGPRARDPETWSLTEFLAHRGGIDPTDPLIGDVRGSIGTKNKFVPGFGNLIRKGGMRLDRAREAAVEAGYLRDAPADEAALSGGSQARPSESTVRDLLDAVDRELRGERVYREGKEPAGKIDAEEERHHIEREAHGALRDDGIDTSAIPDKTMARVVEIMHREGERDPLAAYERALTEEGQNETEAGQHQRITDTIPGWDVPDDAGPASARGGDLSGRGQRDDGGPARDAGLGDREAHGDAAGRDAGNLKPDWQKLADARRAGDEDLAEASRAAEHAPEPESISTDPAKVVSAAERAAAEADKLLEDILPTLSEEERALFKEALDALEHDRDQREQIVREGTACLLAATA